MDEQALFSIPWLSLLSNAAVRKTMAAFWIPTMNTNYDGGFGDEQFLLGR